MRAGIPSAQGAYDRHAGKSVHAGSSHEVQQQRFGLIVAVVCERNEIGAALDERTIARRSCLRFQIGAFASYLDPHRIERYTPAPTVHAAELLPLRRIRTQAVVDVQRSKSDVSSRHDCAQQVEQNDRVDATAQAKR
jgi:hypothetical protein